MLRKITFILSLLLSQTESISGGILYPRLSETRQLITLDGLWDFVQTSQSNLNQGREEKWYEKNLNDLTGINVQFMAVPASWNDISPYSELREQVGPVYYQRKFVPPKSWATERIWIRFGSVCRNAQVWINGKDVMSHPFGYLPFQKEVTSVLNLGRENIITVEVDGTLNNVSVPQGEVIKLPNGRLKQTWTFEFYSYSGIHRPIILYSTPKTFIDDITITTHVRNKNAAINYTVSVDGNLTGLTTKITILDKEGKAVSSATSLTGQIQLNNPKLWWPYLMDPNPGYQYTLRVDLLDAQGKLYDTYSQKFGIRTIDWDNKSVQMNGKNLYLRGFGRHEDIDVKGKGLDLAVNVRDFNLIKWVGGNVFRTSHYPYSEEMMDMADELGIMVIDENPAVNTEDYNDELKKGHKQAIWELYQRDKNRPAVVIWSAANEPRSQLKEAEAYYRDVVGYLRSLDPSRPITIANYQLPEDDHTGQFLDIASTNIYLGWYKNAGDADTIVPNVAPIIRRWNDMHNIPVMITEYGCGTYPGKHYLPASEFSEEYQTTFINNYWKVFDAMREEGFFVGELIWNFQDYATPQVTKKIGGDKKGIFTRSRHPKAGALLIRKRYFALAKLIDNATLPEDLDYYISD